MLITTFLILSAFLSTAAVARGGRQPSAFYAQQQQQSQQQQQQQQTKSQDQKTPVAEPTAVEHVPAPIETPIGAAIPQQTSSVVQPPPVPPKAEISTSSTRTTTTTTTSSTRLATPPSPTPAKAKPSPPPVVNTPVPVKPPVISVKPPPATAPAPPPLPKEYKYFHESGSSYELSHYDRRFFRGVVPYATHRKVLTHLVRSYLSTFRALHLETWLAHGTLIGWWWNGLTLPWDFDLDTQVSGETMRILGERHNGSLHEYTFFNETSGKDETRVYLLDVNPFANRIDRGQGQNVIDARWIDVGTGMFVDITGLQERDPVFKPGVVSCKNFHGYKKEEIWPLRETDFEGVPAMVPWDFEGILVAEYGAKSLVVTEWAE